MTTTGREGDTRPSSAELRALLDETGLSNAALARAVVAAGAEEGVHVGTNTTSVKRMLDGSQPRWPVPRLVAKVLSAHLHREISVTECGFADESPATDDRYDGLRCSGTLDGTVRTVVELTGRDMNRRRFLVGSAFTAGAFSEPALVAITVPPAEHTARVAGRRIGLPDVEILTEHIAHLRRLDFRYGSGRIREEVVQLLHREANSVMHGTYSEKIGKALLGAVAQASRLAGSMAADVGRHSLAQRYYIQTLNLAMSAGDRLFAANMLCDMARLTLHIGQGAATEHDRLRSARQAVALTRAAQHVASGKATPRLSAQMYAIEARGHAMLADLSNARIAVREALRHHEHARPDSEPLWFNFYTDAELAADLGRSLREMGDAQQAIRLMTQAMDGYELWRVRSRCFVQTDLATAHLVARDYEQTAALGRDAVHTAGQVTSTRTLDRLRALQRRIRPLGPGSVHLREVDDRITDLLNRTRTRRDEDATA